MTMNPRQPRAEALAVGERAVEQALNAYEAALTAHPRDDHRHRIEHCEVIRKDQIRRARRLGVALAIQPPFNHYWPHTEYYSLLGEERAWKVDPVRTLMHSGLLAAGGSDSTVTPLGPLIDVHAAVNHSNPAEQVTVQEALELYTVNAARIAFEEGDKGSLEAAKFGDFVALAADPFEVDPAHIKDIPIEMTVIGGQQFPLWGKIRLRKSLSGYLVSEIAHKDFRSLAVHYKPGIADWWRGCLSKIA